MGSTCQEAEDASLTEDSDIRFIPPLYEQRYQEITRIARECQPKKVVDIGCGELRVVRLLKFHRYIHELIGLDIDADLLKQHSYLIDPLAASYINPLPHPLVITLLHGSIAERDSRLLNCDLVVCVEVIEHLYPDSLTEATKVIFGYMQPVRAVFTTPNAEFNVLFPRMQGFRHDDHKFEWTRSEFQDWGNAICSEYGYTVEYSGLGTGPKGSEHLGYCTQTAVFDRISLGTDGPVEPTDEGSEARPYSEVARAVYYSKQLGDKDIVAEAELRVRQLLKDAGRMMDDEEGVFDNAVEDDDDTIRTWMKQSLAARAKEREEQSGVRVGGGSNFSLEGKCSVPRTAAENCSSDRFTSAIKEETNEALQSISVCHSRQVLNDMDHEKESAEENLCDTLSCACQTSQEGSNRTVPDLSNILAAVSNLQLRDGREHTKELEKDSLPENSRNIHQSNKSMTKPKLQSIGRTDLEDFPVGNVLDFEECAHVSGLRNAHAFTSMNVEDTSTSFYEQWEKGFPRKELSYDLEDLKIIISLERLMMFPKLQEMCSDDVSKLREVLLASGKFQFSADGGAVIADLYEDSSDSEMWEAGSAGDWDSESQGSQGEIGIGKSADVDEDRIGEVEECWD